MRCPRSRGRKPTRKVNGQCEKGVDTRGKSMEQERITVCAKEINGDSNYECINAMRLERP